MLSEIAEYADFIRFEQQFGLKIVFEDALKLLSLKNQNVILSDFLDFCEEHETRVTFFLSSKNILKRRKIVNRIMNQEHEICSHGFNHLLYSRLSKTQIINELTLDKKAFGKFDISVKGFRPPFLSMNPFLLDILKEFDFTYMSSKVSGIPFFYENKIKEFPILNPSDWEAFSILKISKEEFFKNWEKNLSNNLIVLNHPWILSNLKEEFYSFLKQKKDWRISSLENGLKMSFDVY